MFEQKRLDSFFGSSDSFGLIFDHGSGRIYQYFSIVRFFTSVEDNRPSFINSCDQQGNSVGSGHGFLPVARIAFAEVQHLVRYCLSQSLYFYPLIVDKLMILTLDSAVFHQRFGICSQSILNYRSIVKLPAGGTCNVVIQFENLFD